MALAPKKSPFPKAKPKNLKQRNAEAGAVARGNTSSKYEAEDLKLRDMNKKACGGKMRKMATGGKVRGMGAATKGGNFSKNG